jgi:hypothetical protein
VSVPIAKRFRLGRTLTLVWKFPILIHMDLTLTGSAIVLTVTRDESSGHLKMVLVNLVRQLLEPCIPVSYITDTCISSALTTHQPVGKQQKIPRRLSRLEGREQSLQNDASCCIAFCTLFLEQFVSFWTWKPVLFPHARFVGNGVPYALWSGTHFLHQRSSTDWNTKLSS